MRRTARRIGLGLALLVLAGAGIGWWRMHRLADVGAGFMAKQMCSCVFVGGRSLESCLADAPASMERVRAELLPDRSGVRGFVPLLASRRALHEPRTGCTLH